jgi:translation elongation factor EF-Ts
MIIIACIVRLTLYYLYLFYQIHDLSIHPQILLGKALGVVGLSISPTISLADQQQQQQQVLLQENIGRKIAMHIVAAKPLYLHTQQIPSILIEQERNIFQEQMKDDSSLNKKKSIVSDDVLQKILQGKLQKRLNEICLLSQNHLAEEGNPIIQKFLYEQSQKLSGDIQITDFALWTLNQ